MSNLEEKIKELAYKYVPVDEVGGDGNWLNIQKDIKSLIRDHDRELIERIKEELIHMYDYRLSPPIDNIYRNTLDLYQIEDRDSFENFMSKAMTILDLMLNSDK